MYRRCDRQTGQEPIGTIIPQPRQNGSFRCYRLLVVRRREILLAKLPPAANRGKDSGTDDKKLKVQQAKGDENFFVPAE